MAKAGSMMVNKTWLIFAVILVAFLFITFLGNSVIIYFTKKNKVVTIKKIQPTYQVNIRRKSIPTSIRPSYTIQDEDGNYYFYKYGGSNQFIANNLSAAIKDQDKRIHDVIKTADYAKIAALKPGDRVEITYYGIITRSVLDVN